MKGKIIEKRVIKMKKVFVTLLMLMMVVGLFANNEPPKTLKISADVGGENKVAFTETEFQDIGSSWTEVLEGSEKAKLTKEGNWETTFYASVDTNSASLITVKIYATGLVRNNIDTPIVLKIGGDPGIKDFNAAPTEDTANNGITTGDPVVFSETSTSNPSKRRAFSKKLTISAPGLEKALAGEYYAYITMVVEDGSTT